MTELGRPGILHRVSHRKTGLTLLDLLIVVVVIGIIAAIAIPKIAASKEKPYVDAMKADLRSLATYQSDFAADSAGRYFSGSASDSTELHGFRPSRNVSVTASAGAGSPSGWTATAKHSLTSTKCEMAATGAITCK